MGNGYLYSPIVHTSSSPTQRIQKSPLVSLADSRNWSLDSSFWCFLQEVWNMSSFSSSFSWLQTHTIRQSKGCLSFPSFLEASNSPRSSFSRPDYPNYWAKHAAKVAPRDGRLTILVVRAVHRLRFDLRHPSVNSKISINKSSSIYLSYQSSHIHHHHSRTQIHRHYLRPRSVCWVGTHSSRPPATWSEIQPIFGLTQ